MKTHIERYPASGSVNETKKINTFNELKDYWNDGLHCFRVSNFDLSALDFSTTEGQTILKQLKYNKHTIFPKEIHLQMMEQLEKAKNPGLGIKSAHRMGYTGKNITCAIIDQPTLIQHPEYQIFHYKEIGFEEFYQKHGFLFDAQMHGPAVDGILCGIAPNIKLVHIAAAYGKGFSKCTNDDTHRCEALRYLLEYNRTLPEQDKIRFISCSWGTLNDLNIEKRKQLFQQLEDEGVMVFGGCWGIVKNRYNAGLGRDLAKSCNDVHSYYQLSDFHSRGQLLIPQANRTIASRDGEYEYDPSGGASWTYPYLAGVGACALQVNPNFVKQKGWQDKLWQLMLETGVPISKEPNANRIIQPAKLCEKMHEMYLANHRINKRKNEKGPR